MNEVSSRCEPIFLEAFESLPRLGLGSLGCSSRALAYIDAARHVNEPPTNAKEVFESDHPEIGLIHDVLAKIADVKFILIDRFFLQSEAWWQDFYTPMEARIDQVQSRCHEDSEALAVLVEVAQEPGRHRRLSHFCDYEFFSCG